MQVQVPIIYRQIGWMKCVACSDATQLRRGQMWLGVNRHTGFDEYITCPECLGTQQVPRYEVIDTTTGKEIDYEAYGRDADGNVLHHVPQSQGVAHGS